MQLDRNLILVVEQLRASADPAEGEILIASVSHQKIWLIKDLTPVREYPISTSRYGTGNKIDTNQTPLGTHRIARKIGHGSPPGTVFRGRVKTGEMAEFIKDERDTDPDEDRITTRILWLEGLEPGVNQGGDFDTFSRYIYIHGTPQERLIGQPASHGCIRMNNSDVVELFDLVSEGTIIAIVA